MGISVCRNGILPRSPKCTRCGALCGSGGGGKYICFGGGGCVCVCLLVEAKWSCGLEAAERFMPE